MFSQSLKKLKESLLSTLPVIVVVLTIYFVYFPLTKSKSFFAGSIDFNATELTVFCVAALLVVVGMWLFNLGAESSMSKMGELVGASLTKKRSIILVVVICFLFGVLITVAEPDLAVLASQVPINEYVLIGAVGVGVGIFMIIGTFRILLAKSLKVWLLAFYGLMFAFASIIDSTLLPLSMDSGGVTTGPITVPFILALGAGLASSRGGKDSNADSFGLVAFSSIGPILTVMILSIYIKTTGGSATYTFVMSQIDSFLSPFVNALLPHGEKMGALISVTISLIPIVLFFLLYNLIFLKLPGKRIGRMMLGILSAYAGLVIFMMAVDAGFLPIGQKIGIALGMDSVNGKWLLLLVGAILGIAAVFAEPAVHVLTTQIEAISQGAVRKTSVLLALAIGNGLAIALAMLRIIIPDINLLYFAVPGYVLAFLLSFLVPDIYTAIAFDSGGVVSGPMNTTFILPFAIGSCYQLLGEGKILTNAFGTIAVVAMMPLLSIQLIGLGAGVKQRAQYRSARKRVREDFDNQIIHF